MTEIQPVTVNCYPPACLGREPAGLVTRTQAVSTLHAYLAEMARLEAASVHAFRAMAKELARWSAPSRLIADARRAAREERSHARIVGALARRHGGVPSALVLRPTGPRSLFAMALENETEGCVRETFGALVGMHQARFARDPAIRAVMKQIAREESGHAGLSHRVAQWARRRLSETERRALDDARAAALEAARAGIQDAELRPWERMLGLPDARARRVLLDALVADAQPSLAA